MEGGDFFWASTSSKAITVALQCNKIGLKTKELVMICKLLRFAPGGAYHAPLKQLPTDRVIRDATSPDPA